MNSPFDWSNGKCLKPSTLPAALPLPSCALLLVHHCPDMRFIFTAFFFFTILFHVLASRAAWSELYKMISSYTYVFFYDLLISLDIKWLRLIHVEVRNCGFFMSTAVRYSIVWIYSNVFVDFPVNSTRVTGIFPFHATLSQAYLKGPMCKGSLRVYA